MAKTFNVTADCRPGEHYMVNLNKNLSEIKSLVDSGKYFTINKARQYGKTTTLRSLNLFLRTDYYTVLRTIRYSLISWPSSAPVTSTVIYRQPLSL